MKRVESPGYGGRVSPFVGSTTVAIRPSSLQDELDVAVIETNESHRT